MKARIFGWAAVLCFAGLPVGAVAENHATEFELHMSGAYQFLLEKRTGCMWRRAFTDATGPGEWYFDGPMGDKAFCLEVIGRLLSKELGAPVNG